MSQKILPSTRERVLYVMKDLKQQGFEDVKNCGYTNGSLATEEDAVDFILFIFNSHLLSERAVKDLTPFVKQTEAA